MIQPNFQSLVDYCLLNLFNNMGNAKSDIALALLLISLDQPTLKKKAMKIYENECRRIIAGNNWDECLKIILISGLLDNRGLLNNNNRIHLYRLNTKIHTIVTSCRITDDIHEELLVYILLHFLTYPLYHIFLNQEERTKLYSICKLINERMIEGCLFVTESASKICQLAMIVAHLNDCNDAAVIIARNLIVKHSSGLIVMNYPLSILINRCIPNYNIKHISIPHMSKFALYNIIGIWEMTNHVLAEKTCGYNYYTKIFLSDSFINRGYLMNKIADEKHRFSIDCGISRVLITYALSTQIIDSDILKLMAMALMAL